MLTPTAANETLVRERLETEREWVRRLKLLADRRRELRWDNNQIKRMATVAATTARDWLKTELTKRGGPYRVDGRRTKQIEALEVEIDFRMDDDIFERSSHTGIRDRKIVIETMARGYDILASNNVRSIKHERLRHWIMAGPGKKLGIKTTIFSPDLAEEAIRITQDMPLSWTAHAAVRACVSDPENASQAAEEVEAFLVDFQERGMDSIRENIIVELKRQTGFERAMGALRRHGKSRAGLGNNQLEKDIAMALSRYSGLHSSEFTETSAPMA